MRLTTSGSFQPTKSPYADFFRCMAQKVSTERVASVGDTLALLDDTKVSNSVVWETYAGTHVLDRKELWRIAKESLRSNAAKTASIEAAVREAQKADLVTTFKAALKYLDTEMKKAQKELGDETPPEQAFSMAYESLQDEMPAFCAVWDKFTLAKGLREKGWMVRADQEIQAKSPFHDKMLELQQLIGAKVGSMEFQSMSEGLRGVLTLHYATDKGKKMNVHFWYAPAKSAYEINVEKDGEIVASFKEDNAECLDTFLETAAADVMQRFASVRTAADQIDPDDKDDSIPEALGPDRSGWAQMVMQVFQALRDYLRYQVRFVDTKMILWHEQHNGETFEFHMRGDRASVSATIRGTVTLEDDPTLDLECVFTQNGKSKTLLETYDLSKYDTTTELVSDIQEYLEDNLERELKDFEDRPTTIRDVLQRSIPQGF